MNVTKTLTAIAAATVTALALADAEDPQTRLQAVRQTHLVQGERRQRSVSPGGAATAVMRQQRKLLLLLRRNTPISKWKQNTGRGTAGSRNSP